MALKLATRVGAVIGIAVSSVAVGQSLPGPMASSLRAQVERDPRFGELPLSWESNQGQTDAPVRFVSRGQGQTLYLTDNSASVAFDLPQPCPLSAVANGNKACPSKQTSIRFRLIGGRPAGPQRSPRAAPSGEEALAGRVNYLIGNDATRWRTGIPTYARVRYRAVYLGVDLVYYGTRDGHLEHDFVVAPGADPKAIRLRIDGVKSLRLAPSGDLEISLKSTGHGGPRVRLKKPLLYQEIGGARREVAGQYRLTPHHDVQFDVGPYDRAHALVIDPVLVYSTYLTGNNTTDGRGIAVEPGCSANCSAYIVGSTLATDFPTTAGALRRTNAGGNDVFVTKLNATGTAVVYSTYIGGSSDDTGAAIAVDSAGNAYVTGQTKSADFPRSSGAFQTVRKNTQDAFFSKLDATGASLLYSTLLGGDDPFPCFGGDAGRSIAVDASGKAYVAGIAESQDFPTTAGAFLTNAHHFGCSIAFITKFDPSASGSASVVYSTLLGGAGFQSLTDITLDPAGNVYVTGDIQEGSTFPTTPGAYQTTRLGGSASIEGFISKLNPSGSGLVYSTRLGCGNVPVGQTYAPITQGRSIAIDSAGNAYITGVTYCVDFPTTSNPFQTTLAAPSFNAILTKLNPAGTALVYSTYFGGSGNNQGTGIAVDAQGIAYLAGFTLSGFPTTADAFQSAGLASNNPFIARFNPALSGAAALLYSTYFHGAFGEQALGITLDSAASPNIYITGTTNVTDAFPVTAGAFQTATPSARSAFVSRFSLLSPDAFATAPTIVDVPFSATVSTVSATTEVTDPTPACGGGSVADSAWFAFTPPAPGTVTIDTSGSTYGVIIGVYTGGPGSFTPVACAAPPAPGTAARISAAAVPATRAVFAVQQGVHYSIMFSARDGDGGILNFKLTFASASPIPGSAFVSNVPHFIAGGGFVTKMTITNMGLASNAVQVNFIAQNGTVTDTQTFTLGPAATTRVETPESDRFGLSTTRWATVGAQSRVAVNLFFELNGGGGAENIVNTIGFNDAPSLTGFVVPVEMEPTPPPGAPIGRTVGIALANPGAPLQASLQLRNAAGAVLATSIMNLGAFAQTAVDLANVPEFASVLPAGNFLGTLRVSSSAPLSSIALGDDLGPFFSTPPISSGRTGQLTVPHIVSGGGYVTKLTFMDLSGTANSLDVKFFDPNGVQVQQNTVNLAANGTARLSTPESERFLAGKRTWAIVTASGAAAVNLFFEVEDSGGKVINTIGFNDVPVATDFSIPVEFRPASPGAAVGRTVGIAFANPGNSQATITLSLRNQFGAVVATDSLVLDAMHQVAFPVPDRPAFGSILPVGNFVGFLTVTSTVPVSAIALGDDFGPFYATPPIAGHPQ